MEAACPSPTTHSRTTGVPRRSVGAKKARRLLWQHTGRALTVLPQPRPSPFSFRGCFMAPLYRPGKCAAPGSGWRKLRHLLPSWPSGSSQISLLLPHHTSNPSKRQHPFKNREHPTTGAAVGTAQSHGRQMKKSVTLLSAHFWVSQGYKASEERETHQFQASFLFQAKLNI